MPTFIRRLVGAAILDPTVYEELELDPSAFGQSLLVVLLSGLALGVGAYGRLGLAGAISVASGSVFGWLLWAGLTFVIGMTLIRGARTEATWGQLLRTTGFATSPGLLGVLGIFPALSGFIVFVAAIWILLAFVVAVRHALDYASFWPALAVCALGWAIYTGILLALI
jgi:hypothetical protein